MTKSKYDLGHKPEMKEVVAALRAMEKVGTTKVEKAAVKIMDSDDSDDERSLTIEMSIAGGVKNLATVMLEYIESGKMADPFGEDDEAEDKTKEEKNTKKSGSAKYQIEDMDKEKIEESFNIINENQQKTAVKLAKKFGGKNAINLLAGYAEAFLNSVDVIGVDKLAEDGIKDDEDEDEMPVKGMKEVSPEFALNELRKDGYSDVADTIEKLIKGSGDAEMKVFAAKGKIK